MQVNSTSSKNVTVLLKTHKQFCLLSSSYLQTLLNHITKIHSPVISTTNNLPLWQVRNSLASLRTVNQRSKTYEYLIQLKLCFMLVRQLVCCDRPLLQQSQLFHSFLECLCCCSVQLFSLVLYLDCRLLGLQLSCHCPHVIIHNWTLRCSKTKK